MADQQDQNDQNSDPGVSEDEARQLLDVDPNTGKAGSTTDSSEDDPGSAEKDDKGKSEAEKWKALSRKNERELRAAQAKLKEFEDAKLSESERLQKAHEEAKARAAKAESQLSRMRIAAETAPEGATLAQLQKVAKRMAGEDDAALEADAKELWEDFGPRSAPKPPTSKPKERLRGGGDPDEEDDTGYHPDKLAALIPRAR